MVTARRCVSSKEKEEKGRGIIFNHSYLRFVQFYFLGGGREADRDSLCSSGWTQTQNHYVVCRLSTSQSSCLSLLRVGITAVIHHAWYCFVSFLSDLL
jgi:hypothetical protein